MRLKLDRCTIRPYERGDELSIVRHANHRNVWINLRDSVIKAGQVVDQILYARVVNVL
jgi:hypothetical protein